MSIGESRTVSHARILEKVMVAAGAMVHVALPVVVEAFDPVKRTVECQPQMPHRVGQKHVRYSKLTGVPVSYPRGGGFFMGFPLQPGDTGFVICMDQSIDEWLLTGTELEPADQRRHSLSDAVFVPGLSPITDPILAFDGSEFIMGLESGGVSVRMSKTGKVAIGNEVVELLSLFDQVIDILLTTPSSHVVTGTCSTGAIAGSAALNPVLAALLGAIKIQLAAIKGS